MAQELQDTNIIIGPPQRQPEQPRPDPQPIFQPIPVVQQQPVVQPVIQRQPIIQQQPVIQPIIQQQPVVQRQPIVMTAPQQKQPATQPIYISSPQQQQPAPQPIIVATAPQPQPMPQPIYIMQEPSSASSQQSSGYVKPSTHTTGKSMTTAKVHQTTTTKEKHTPAKTKKTHNVNWGGLVKGAVIVTAVALVGVGAYYGGAALTTWAMSNPTISSVAAWIGANIVTPVGSALSSAGAWITGTAFPAITGALSSAFHWVAGGVTSASHSIGLTGPSASVLTAAQTTKTAAVVGTVAAGGTVAYVASHGALNTLDHTHLINHSQTITPATDHVDVTSTVTVDPVVTHTKGHQTSAADVAYLDDIANMNAANSNSLTAQHHATEATHQAVELGQHSFHLANHKSQVAQTVNDQGNADMGTDSGSDLSAPDVDVDDAALAKFSQRQPRMSWRQHLFGSKKHSENYASAVNKRDANYTVALDDDRVKLAAALNQSQI